MKDLAPELEERLRGRLKKARAVLAARGPLETRVHEARVKIKQARAGLRVLRPALGDDAFERRNARLREASRTLSLLRDADVLAETARALAGSSERSAARELARRARLADRRRGVLARARDLLADELSEPEAAGLGPQDFARSVRSDYKRAKRRLKLAVVAGTDESFHAWRRAVKALRFELRLLDGLPPALQELVEALKRLGAELGIDHDASTLVDTLAREPLTFGEPEGVERLVGRARRMQDAARARALRLARTAFGTRAGMMERRVRRALKADKAAIS